MVSNRLFLFRLHLELPSVAHRKQDKSLMISCYCGAADVEMRFPIPFISEAESSIFVPLRFNFKVFTYRCSFLVLLFCYIRVSISVAYVMEGFVFINIKIRQYGRVKNESEPIQVQLDKNIKLEQPYESMS